MEIKCWGSLPSGKETALLARMPVCARPRPGAGERGLELGLEGWGTLEFSMGRWAGKASWSVRGIRTEARELGWSGCGGGLALGASS